MNLSWNKLHVQARKEICWGACISEKLASESWETLDQWLQMLLAYSVVQRSKGKLQLCGEPLEPCNVQRASDTFP